MKYGSSEDIAGLKRDIKNLQDKLNNLEKKHSDLLAETDGTYRLYIELNNFKQDVLKSWNNWIEADKGGDGQLAFIRFNPSDFRKLLSLLHPHEIHD